MKGTQRAGCGEAARLYNSGARPGQMRPLWMLQTGVSEGSPGARRPSVPITPEPSSHPIPVGYPARSRLQRHQLRPKERRRPLVCFQPPPRDDTGGERGGKIPGVEIPGPIPSVLDCECAGSVLPFIPLGRQIAQLLQKPRTRAKPQCPPARRLPSHPASRWDECVCGRVCEGECVSGWVSVRESRTPSVAHPADATACAGPGPPLLGRVRRIIYLP